MSWTSPPIMKDGHYPKVANETHAVIVTKVRREVNADGEVAEAGFSGLEQWGYRPASPGSPGRSARNKNPVREGEFSLTRKNTGIYDGRKYWVIK
jgi:hypothetical protein